VVGDRVIGVLQVFDSQNSAFNREETEYLKSFSEEAVLQIQNARKFDDVKNEFDVLRDDLWEYLDKLDWE
jgi:GAF domain-containing protein